MSSDVINSFTKDNLDIYLKELAKEYRKRGGRNITAEIILIGGAAILAGYGFREMTTDVDAVVHAASTMKEAIHCVGDKYNLPNGWLNSDFMQTSSYSVKLNQYSVYYKTFFNILTVRMITGEYLVAMKLRSGRRYKNDMSDIIGILAEHEKKEHPITMKMIENAVENLYGSWNAISEDSQIYIQNVLKRGNYEAVYKIILAEERKTKGALIDFESVCPGIANTSNINQIINGLEIKRESKSSVLEMLRRKKSDEKTKESEENESE